MNYIAGLLVVLFCFPLSAQTDADWDWMSRNFEHALQHFFPLNSGEFVSYRSHRDLYTDALEYSFTLRRDPSSKGYPQPYFSAHVRLADSVSVYDQMMALHRRMPSRAAAEVEKQVRLKQWNLTESSCPAIRSQFAKLEQLRVLPPRFDVIVLHPLIHEFHIQGGTGEMHLALYEPENPLVVWATETRNALESCAANPN